MPNNAVNFKGLPKTLTDLNQWIPWANVVTDLHPAGSKEPRNCHQPKYRSGSTDKTGWGSLEQAREATKNPEISGVGFCFVAENNMTTIDLDDCLIDGKPNNLAKEILDIFGGKTYVEVSFHGDGLHIEFIGSLPEGYPGGFYRKEDNENSPEIEIYSTGRFMAQTGNRLEGTNPDLTDCQKELDEVLKLYPFKKKTKKTTPQLFISDNTDKISADFGLTCMNIGPPGNAKPTDTGFKGAHPFHGSKTGMNYFVDTKRDVWYCFHKGHDSGGDAIILYAVKKGIIRCEDAGPGCLEGKWAEVYAALEKDGYKSKKKEADLEEGKKFMAALTKGTDDKTFDQNIEADKIIARCYFNADDIGEWPEIIHPIFKEWQELGSILSYSRTPFHFASLIPLLSMGINRKACLKIGVLDVYTNLNVMVGGVSTISGKSYANDTAIKIFNNAIIDTDYKWANSSANNSMVTGVWSHAVIVNDLCLNNNIFWYYNECQQFFDDADGWNSPIIPLLNTAYDCDVMERKLSERNKKKHKEVEKDLEKCKTPFISLLFNMTLNQLKENCTGKIFKSGFSPRWLYFIETDGEIKKNIPQTKETLGRIISLRNEVYEISKTLNKINPNSVIFNINDRIEEWKITTSKKYGGSEYHQTAIGRGFIHIYKLAMIFTMYDKEFLEKEVIGKTYPVYVDIPDCWVNEAIKIYQGYLFPRIIKVLEMSKIEDKENKQAVILDRLKELHGVATRSQLLQSTKKFVLSRELTEILNTLMESGNVVSVDKHSPGSDGKGRKTTYYCLTNEKDAEALGKIMDQKPVATG